MASSTLKPTSGGTGILGGAACVLAIALLPFYFPLVLLAAPLVAIYWLSVTNGRAAEDATKAPEAAQVGRAAPLHPATAAGRRAAGWAWGEQGRGHAASRRGLAPLAGAGVWQRLRRHRSCRLHVWCRPPLRQRHPQPPLMPPPP